ncbi:MAG: rhodanese-like domain-containing protein [Cyanobacteriota bacterium]
MMRTLSRLLLTSGILGLMWAGDTWVRIFSVPVPGWFSAAAQAESMAQLQEWVVSPETASELIQQGATLLDARDVKLHPQGFLKGSVLAPWREFSQQEAPHNGKLLTDDALLTEKLQALGVFQNRPVVVVGDSVQGWGEDGRIVWMLRSLGHSQAVMVDGGYGALVTLGIPTTTTLTAPQRGDFEVQRTDLWTIDRDTLQASLGSNSVVIIDSREAKEYEGATPYGEARGGHIPGAVHLHYKELMDAQGSLLPPEEIRARLQKAGVNPEAEIISYCTAGIRSAWLTTVLANLGLQAKNYPGSIYEWAASDPQDYPLEK